MSDIGEGDIVECIVGCNEETAGILAHWLCGAEIVQGRLYTVLRVIHDLDQHEVPSVGLVLVEADTQWPRSRDGELGAWAIEHFRPVYRRNAELLRGLLEPTRSTVSNLVGAKQ